MKVHFVKSARKANPVAEVGDSYYWWAFRRGGKRYSRTHPRPSQLTQSEYLSAVRSAVEMAEDYDLSDEADCAGLKEEAMQILQDQADECEGKRENMPESLQYSPTGEMLQERVDACIAAIEDIEAIVVPELEDVEESDFDGEEDQDDLYQQAMEEAETSYEAEIDTFRGEVINAISGAEV